MKLFFKKVALTCVLAIFLCAVACQPTQETKEMALTVTVVSEADGLDKTFEISAEVATAYDVLTALAGKNAEFTFSGKESQYGLYIESLCGITAEANEYWGIYTDQIRNISGGGVNAEDGDYNYIYKESAFYQTLLGISTYPVAEGEHLLLVLFSF